MIVKPAKLHEDAGASHVNARLEFGAMEIDISMYPSTDNLPADLCFKQVQMFAQALETLHVQLNRGRTS